MLVRQYECDVAFTPMIIADSFVHSAKARANEFTTSEVDRPLVVQFAAKTAEEFSTAAQLVSPYCDAVDLNCGCPQRWAIKECYGCYLLNQPELVADMVRQTKCNATVPVSIKIRVSEDMRKTVELVRRAEKAGVEWITVHGRTVKQRAEPVDYDSIKQVVDSVSIPVFANGDITQASHVGDVCSRTGARGVMAARGILSNPGMFAGHSQTTLDCIQSWVDIALSTGTPFTTFHHHLMYMLEKAHSKADRQVFNTLGSIPAVLNFLESHYGIS
ncbi:tRNA-dihydrouridine(20a/20b) synthase [NAD(P)+]-like isoform X2 [Sycon ciliatum]